MATCCGSRHQYDAAQDRGEVAKVGQPSIIPDGNNKPAIASEIGLSSKDIHEARTIRDAEAEEPGIVLLIESGARRRLADEYDAAQPPDAAVKGRPKSVPDENAFSAKGAGLTRKEVYEARIIRDAEVKEPGIIARALDQMLKANEEPTRAKVSRVVKEKRKQTRGPRFVAPVESQHDRDLRMLLGVWETACESARNEFLQTVN